MESKFKELMKRIEVKHSEIKKLWEEKHAKKIASYELKLKAMAEYSKALEAKDQASMKKTEEMCWEAKKLKMDAKKMGVHIIEAVLEMKKMKNEYCQTMLDWEKELMHKKYSFNK